VNNFCDRLDLWISNGELFAQRFKGAVLSTVTKTIALEHIEANSRRLPAGIVGEYESSVGIDKASDEPSGLKKSITAISC
jgi:hypothetical protein